MIKADIINRVADEAKITKVKAVEAVEAVFDAMKSAMKRGERIELRGFGVFQVKTTQEGHRSESLEPGARSAFLPARRSDSSQARTSGILARGLSE